MTGQSNSLPTNTNTIPSASLVTVVCICYNHQDYVIRALQSVINQTYAYIELIIVDNASTDQSVNRIAEFIQQYPNNQFIQNPVNIGLNRAFNQGLRVAHGHYIIDLSADDILLPDRIAKQVSLFDQLPDSYGVVFSNAAFIDAKGRQIGFHHPIDNQGKACVSVPTGEVFKFILNAYFICTPTMMIRRDVLTEIRGYDEALSYEDFDFWVRSSRRYLYAYQDDVLTLKRQMGNSLSTQVILPDNNLLSSTLIVCQKAFDLCITSDELQALARRIQTFIRKAFYAEQFMLALQFGALLCKIAQPDQLTHLVLALSRLRLPVNRLYRVYIKFRTKPLQAIYRY